MHAGQRALEPTTPSSHTQVAVPLAGIRLAWTGNGRVSGLVGEDKPYSH